MGRLPVYLNGVKWNAFDQSRSITFSGKIGKIYPVEFYVLNFGDPICTKNNHLLRFAPMLSPMFSEMRFDIDTFVVPFRVLYPEGIDKFNLATNPSGWNLPSFPLNTVIAKSGGLSKVSLLDFFDMGARIDVIYRMLNNTFVDALSNERVDPFYWTDVTSSIVTPIYYRLSDEDGGNSAGDYVFMEDNLAVGGNYTYFAYQYSTTGKIRFQSSSEDLSDFQDWFSLHNTFEKFLLEVGLTAQAWYDIVLDFLASKLDILYMGRSPYTKFVEIFYAGLSVPDFLIRAYNKIYIDYYAQTQVIDPDSWESANVLQVNPNTGTNFSVLSRFYGDDYFTSSYPNSQVGDAVEIPSDGTMVDLANASALQRLRIRLNYTGKRIKDFAKNIFDVNVPDSRLDRSEFLNRVTYKIQISDVAQTSQTTQNSELAGFSGRGISWGKDVRTKWTATEPCIVMVMASVRPDTYYSLGMDPYMTIRNTLDFPVPDMENVGNHPISKILLSARPEDETTVFAWNRPYYPFLNRSLNRVCGHMRDIYSYWTTYRDIGNMVYNKDWLSVQDDESVNRIFTVKNVDQYRCHVHFWTTIGRPISKTVKFEI